MFSKTRLKTKSPGRNVCGFTRRLCKFASLCLYNAMQTTTISQSSSVVSMSLAMTSAFAFSRISPRMVSTLISMGKIAFIPYVRANSDMPVGF